MKKLTVVLVFCLVGLISYGQVKIDKKIEFKGYDISGVYLDINKIIIDLEEDMIYIDSDCYLTDAKKGKVGEYNFVVPVDSIMLDSININLYRDFLYEEIKVWYNLSDFDLEKKENKIK